VKPLDQMLVLAALKFRHLEETHTGSGTISVAETDGIFDTIYEGHGYGNGMVYGFFATERPWMDNGYPTERNK